MNKNKSSWRMVADAARNTIGMKAGTKEPPSSWKKQMLLAEHSPIRLLTYTYLFEDIKSWVSVHLTRHSIGIEHFVKTQRTDRTGIDRENLPQGTLVNHLISANAQAIINISRKRLCACASPETREVWKGFVSWLESKSPELVEVCVPECVYRGFCPEIEKCGYAKTEEFKNRLEKYRH